MDNIKKMYAVDLDGTLLRDDKTISEASKQYLINFQDESNILCFVTGRTIENVRDYLNILGRNGYVITNDGIRLFSSDGALLHENENLRLRDIMKIIGVIPWTSYLMCFKNNDEILVAKNRLSITYLVYLVKKIKKRVICFYSIKDFERIYKNDSIDKVLIGSINLKRNYCKISKKLKNTLQVFCLNDEKKIQVMNSKVNKLYEICNLKSYLNISDCDVYVFGNDRNDEMMLNYFTNSFAVANSPDDIKRAAKHIIPSNNCEGVIRKLQEIRGVNNER